MKVKVIVEIPEEEMNEFRNRYEEGWTDEEIIFENIYVNANSYLQDIEIIITK